MGAVAALLKHFPSLYAMLERKELQQEEAVHHFLKVKKVKVKITDSSTDGAIVPCLVNETIKISRTCKAAFSN